MIASRARRSPPLALLAALVATACSPDAPRSLGPAEETGGPRVEWQLEHEPLPRIPLPNDVATRLDPDSPTGRRVNVSEIAPTSLESELRDDANELDGFGIFMPVTVPLSRRPDLAEVVERHHGNDDPDDDVLHLLNVDPDSPGFGERVPLSLGDGTFPLVLEEPGNYFDQDPRSESMNLLYEVVQEDADCDGELDDRLPGTPARSEDTDGDGRLDRPNTIGLEWQEDANCNGTLDPGEDRDCDGELDTNPNLVGEPHEDLNCNGELDQAVSRSPPTTPAAGHRTGEDRDCDGELDTNPELVSSPPGDEDGDLVVDEGESWSCSEVRQAILERRRGVRDRLLADHLLRFYERQTNTLIARPKRPLRPQTTYAVVVTEHLADAEGRAVRSPFPDRAHASQREALEPLPAALDEAGLELAMDEVAFAWTYTTGSTTRTLEALRAGLYGEGPFAWLAEDFPVDGYELERLRSGEDVERPRLAPGSALEGPFAALAEADILGASPRLDHVDHLVVGSYEAPNFLVDRDGIATEANPANDDESFDVDVDAGEATVGTGRVTFWCAIPKPSAPGSQPFPVQLYGHGYTSSRLEGLPVINRFARNGIATCALDAFGHGLRGPASEPIDCPVPGTPDDATVRSCAEELFGSQGLGPFVEAMTDGRDRDLDNDGRPESGGDFWTSDTFHTRDVVRQSVVDTMQLLRILRSFDGRRRTSAGGARGAAEPVAGDFDGDGTPDLGGPDASYHYWGISLGGILAGVLGGIEPALDGVVPVSGGAGLIDIGVRSKQSGVPEAVFMPMLGPLVTAKPVGDDGTGPVELAFVVRDVTDRARIPFARTGAIEAGDRVTLTNLDNGERSTIVVPEDRRFRLTVAADALDATEKRPLLGFDEEPPGEGARTDGPGTRPRPVAHPGELGDRLAITIYDGDTGRLEASLDEFGLEARYQGAVHPPGTPLIALSEGLGFTRNSPDLRRFMGIAHMILQPADPVAYAPHYWKRPLDFPYDAGAEGGSNVLVVPTAGDMNVPVNTGIMMAAAAGTVGIEEPDPRYGRSQLDFLVDQHVMEGVERLRRWRIDPEAGDGEPARTRPGLYDVDDLDEGRAPFDAPSPDEPLRATRTSDGAAPSTEERCEGSAPCGTRYHDEGGLQAMRIPYVEANGSHGFDLQPPPKDGEQGTAFDVSRYMLNQIAWFFRSDGTELVDDVCLGRGDCEFLPDRSP